MRVSEGDIFARGGYHVGLRRTMLKVTQDPSMQVNSGQRAVVFLLPGGAGETVLSGQSKFKKYTRDYEISHYHVSM